MVERYQSMRVPTPKRARLRESLWVVNRICGKNYKGWTIFLMWCYSYWASLRMQLAPHKLLAKLSMTNCPLYNIVPRRGFIGDILLDYKVQVPNARYLPSTRPVPMAATQAQGPSSSTNLQLYSHWQSSCSWRVRFALNLKGLAYEYKAVDFSRGEHLTPEFERLSPLHFVPVLVDGDLVVSESFAILLYLEEKYPQNALLPRDLKKKAVNLQAANIVNSNIQPLHMTLVLKQIEEKTCQADRISWAQQHIGKGLSALEKLLKDFAGKYATGDEVCMADVFLAPQMSVAITRFNVDVSKYPTLTRIYEAYKVLPAFQDSSPERQPDAVIK